jgi:hypothetical protein
VNWTGFSGAPGYSHFIFGGVSDGGDDSLQVGTLRTFLSSLATSLPNDVALSIEPTLQSLDDNSGDVIGESTVDPGAIIVGTDTGNYSAASGIVFVWHTGLYRNSREVRGRTFIVPCAGSVYGTDTGAPLSSKVSALTTAAQTLVTNVSGGMYINSSGGQPRFVHVTGGNLSPRAAILRSRRD